MPSAPARPAYRYGAPIIAAFLLIAARQPTGELTLDAADPVVAVYIAGVPLRLRVDLDQQDSVELNPAAAARLPIQWEDGNDMDVGRVRLKSRVVLAPLLIAGRSAQVELSQHGRDCCAGTDGAIGPDLLPYAAVRWRRSGAPIPTGTIVLPIDASETTGLSAQSGSGSVRLRFAIAQSYSVATAAAGLTLMRLWEGRWRDPIGSATLAFGIRRPVRTAVYARPGLLGGFRFDTLPVRINDFAGSDPVARAHIPADPVNPGEIVVSRRLEPQHAWSAVMLGADRLSRCAEILYTAKPRTLTLHCAFDGR